MPATPLTARNLMHRKIGATSEVAESQKWLETILRNYVSLFIKVFRISDVVNMLLAV